MSTHTLASLAAATHDAIEKKSASSDTRKKTEFWLNIVMVGRKDDELKVLFQLGGTGMERMFEMSPFGDSEQRRLVAKVRNNMLKLASALAPGEECIVGPKPGEFVEGINLIVRRTGEELIDEDDDTPVGAWFNL